MGRGGAVALNKWPGISRKAGVGSQGLLCVHLHLCDLSTHAPTYTHTHIPTIPTSLHNLSCIRGLIGQLHLGRHPGRPAVGRSRRTRGLSKRPVRAVCALESRKLVQTTGRGPHRAITSEALARICLFLFRHLTNWPPNVPLKMNLRQSYRKSVASPRRSCAIGCSTRPSRTAYQAPDVLRWLPCTGAGYRCHLQR